MKLSKLDLSNVVAIAHTQGNLQLLLDLGGKELEFLEISLPVEAFEGLQYLNEIVAQAKAKPSFPNSVTMLPVKSPMANAIEYEGRNKILQVEFRHQAVYQYTEVDKKTCQDLHEASSAGKFFNEKFRGKYQYDRIDFDHDC
ncbi:KTSC domain-containing protein [Chlorogloeopsis sp. ULAP01]|uniref:KTSC domain-containing protein n=1 Tax=Chlorogloeopsis sp. ULAP01 TaxID=3056483 RepID=UPI0025AAA9F2|nr:KTSC domain-containing protein [Chlorogloeopsis sp. ULAP01]MDM9380349.1 KTSC domain-containing protein [Chlorogloeopsis sp. ULAP01]